MESLGRAGAFRRTWRVPVPMDWSTSPAAIRAMAAVSHECLSTGFATWCQDTCAWYVQLGNSAARELWLEGWRPAGCSAAPACPTP